MLGARIASLRRSAGMSQADLAQKLQISPSAVGMYEQGRREPSVDTLVALSEIFRVSTDFLLTGRAAAVHDREALVQTLLQTYASADRRLDKRPERPFTRQELAVLVAAMLMEP